MLAKKEITDVFREETNQTNPFHATLPIPPSVNSMYYNTKGGKRRKTAQAENYERDARALLNLFIDEQKWSKVKSKTWLFVDLVFYFPDPHGYPGRYICACLYRRGQVAVLAPDRLYRHLRRGEYWFAGMALEETGPCKD